MNREAIKLRRMLVSALLLAIALVLKTFFSIDIPLLGENGMSVGIAGVFSMLPSILFGPFYGAAVSGLSDLLGYIIKPGGAYMPLLTLTAALGGFLRGGIFVWLKNRSEGKLRLAVAILTVLMLMTGLGSMMCLQSDGMDANFYERVAPEQAMEMTELSPVGRMLVMRTANTKNPTGNLATYMVCLTSVPLACAGFCALVLLADWFAARRILIGRPKARVLAMLLAVLISGVIVTTLNTVVMRETLYESWKILPFAVVWIPRAIEELLAGVVKVCCMAMLMGACSKALRNLIH